VTDAGASVAPPARDRFLVAASAISSLGSGVASLAFSYISYKISGSLAVAVLVLAFQAVPSALLIKPATYLARRFDLRWVVAASDGAKFLLYLAVACLVLAGYMSLELLFATALISGALSAISYPAWNKLLVQVAPQGGLDKLDASLSSWGALAGIVGVVAGGQMLDHLGASVLFFVNAASYLVPLIAVLRLPARAPVPPPPALRQDTLLKDARFLWSVAALRRVVILAVLLELIAWPVLKLLPRMADEVDPSPQTFSLLLGAFYLGNAGVSAFLARGKKNYGYQAILFASLTVLGLALFIVWITGLLPGGLLHLLVLMAVMAPVGLALSLVTTVISASIQLGAPDGREIRVLAVYSAAVTLVTPIGGLIITGLVSFLDIWLVVAVEAVGVIALAAYMGWSRIGRDLRDFTARDKSGDVLRFHGRHNVASLLDRGVVHRSPEALARLGHRAAPDRESPGSIGGPTGA
jgi:MFS family permease